MNIGELFIRRPVAALLLTFALVLGGLLGWSMLSVAPLPQVEYPTIVVSTFYPGADADVMARTVNTPLENQLGQIEGVEDITSQSTDGASVVTLRFGLDGSLPVAEQEVQAAINNAGSLLPSDLPQPPIYKAVNPADAPVLTLSATSDALSITQMQDLIATRLLPKLSQINGVGAVNLEGVGRKAYRIRVNLGKLTSYGIALDSLRTIIGTVNVNSPSGTFDGPEYGTSLKMDGQIRKPRDLSEQIIAYQNNGPVRLKDVASVVEGPENANLAAWDGTQSAIIVNIQKQPGSNVIRTVETIKKALPTLKKLLPASVNLTIAADRTVTIKASVEDVEFELGLSVLLVVLIVFLFLQSVPSTFIPALTVPVSLIGSLGGLYLLGYSLDNLSLMALAIATGFVIDDAIVVLENISRHIENGLTPWNASIKGTREISFTIVSLTLSLIAVLIPLFFMSDLIGRLFHEFVVTLILAILISGAISLTLTPMLCARMLSPHTPQNKPVKNSALSRLTALASRFQTATLHRYGDLLHWTFAHRKISLGFFFFCFGLTMAVGYFIPKSFFPTQDTGMISGVAEYNQDISFSALKERQRALNNLIERDPDVSNVTSYGGVGPQNLSPDTARLLIALKPLEQRSSSVTEIEKRLDRDAYSLGIHLYLRPVQDLSLNTAPSDLENQFVLQSTNAREFADYTPKLIEALKRAPSVQDVGSDYKLNGKRLNLDLDRSTAARYAITPETVDNLLYDGFGQRQISTIYTQSNQYRVILELEPSYTDKGLAVLDELYLPGISSASGESSSGPTRHPTSGLVPLKQVVRVSQSNAPLAVSHAQGFPSTLISFSVKPDASLSDALGDLEKIHTDIGLPESFHLKFQGALAAFSGSTSHEAALILAAIIAIYIILGVLYESFVHPITILTTLPPAALGALLGLKLFGMPLDMMGLIGIILLIGIVKKNAIMMIDFALVCEREQGMNAAQAIYQAALLRFRPIMMTTLAALLGALPLMLGHGVGSELRRPLGVSIVAGLILSQFLTLVTTPVLYLVIEEASAYLARLRKKVGI